MRRIKTVFRVEFGVGQIGSLSWKGLKIFLFWIYKMDFLKDYLKFLKMDKKVKFNSDIYYQQIQRNL